jgi:hypothetical protein
LEALSTLVTQAALIEAALVEVLDTDTTLLLQTTEAAGALEVDTTPLPEMIEAMEALDIRTI